MKKVKKERGKGKFCQKRETAANIGHLLRLEQRTCQTAQRNDRQLSGASQTRTNEDKTLERNGQICMTAHARGRVRSKPCSPKSTRRLEEDYLV